MKKLFVGFDDLGDARTLGNQELMINVLRSHIAEGGVVIVEHRFENPPVIVASFDTVEALNSWLR